MSVLEVAFEDGLGYSLREMTAAVDQATAEAWVACMRRDGWPEEPTVAEPFDPNAVPRKPVGEQLLDDLTITEPESGEEDNGLPEQYYLDTAKCWDEAAAAYPDPATAAWNWIAEQTEDFNARVSADPRVVAAEREEAECVALAGYDPAQLERIEDSFFADAQAAVEAYRVGQIDVDEATERLATVATAQQAYWDATDPCTEARLAAAGQVRNELEAVWLEENGDALAVAVTELETDVANLSDQLRKLRDE